jgi:hypothetical protein
MDYGDIVRLLIFGFIILSFLSGLFGRSGKDKQAKQEKPRPARPTQLSESGGQALPRPVVIAEPAGPVTVFAGDSVPHPDARRPEGLERSGDDLAARRVPLERDLRDTDRPPLERDIRDTEGVLLERDITDMPSIAADFDPENRPRRRRQHEVQRRRRIVEGGDVLRHSLKDPATLERAFIVKEVLDRPLALRDDR